MKTLRFLCLLFCFISSNAFAQSTVGTDFWVTFMPNYTDTVTVMPVELNVVVAAKRTCEVSVMHPQSGWIESLIVDAGTTTINIPSELAYFENASDTILNNAFHVACKDSISLYVSNYRKATFDVSNVLPVNTLGCSYIVQVSPPYPPHFAPYMCSEISIVATEDETAIEIDLTYDSQNGHFAHQPFCVTLDAGQSYQIQCDYNGPSDLSGTRITSVDGKPIAVFAGDRGCEIPLGHYAVEHIFEQMIPIEYWGQRFVVMRSGSLKDKVRVTALNDNCRVFKDGALLITLVSGETFEFETDREASYIETTEPALVYKYLTCATYNFPYPGPVLGDPSMVYVAPLSCPVDYAMFPTFSQSCEYHYVNVVTETAYVGGMMLDGLPIDACFRVVPGKDEYSFANIEIGPTSHTLSCSLGGFIADTYGLGEWESYAFSVGANFSGYPLHIDGNAGLDVAMYPIPAQTEVTVEAEELIRIRLLDAFGLLVLDEKCMPVNVVKLDVSAMPQGVYLLEITTTKGKTTKRLVIAK